MRGNEVYYYIDGFRDETSNWLKFLNCPRTPGERNVRRFQCFDKVYFVTWKDILPGQELLVYYGDDFAKHLGIKTELFLDEYM